MSLWRHPVAGGLAVTFALAGVVALHRAEVAPLPPLERLERWGLDWLFLLRGSSPAGAETVILAFDDASMARDPTLWERRAGWARVVRAAKAGGAKVIGIDAFFSNRERILPADLEEAVEQYLAAGPPPVDPAVQLLERVRGAIHGDEELASAMAEAGNVVLGLHLDASFPDEEPPVSVSRGKYGQSLPGPVPLRRGGRITASLPLLTEQARGLGSLSVAEDDTLTVRSFELGRGGSGGVFMPFAVQLVAQYLEVPRGRLVFEGPTHRVRIGDRQVDGQAEGLWINYRGPAGTIPTYSVADLVEGKLPEGALRGKIVLIGITQFWQDKVRTPFGVQFPGVEVNATMVDNLLRGDPLRRAPGWLDSLACLAMGLGLTALFWPRLLGRPSLQVAGSVGLVLAWLALVWAAFLAQGIWLFWSGPVAAFAAVGGVCLVLSYFGEGLQRARLRKAFAHYLGDDVIRQMLANPGMLRLGGERRTLTVLFSDIRDFTTLSERLSPEQLVSFLNSYLTPMTQAVLERGGLLDKYIGDALMAVFGAPLPREDHPAQALGCVLQMHQELEARQASFASVGQRVAIGVGVNTGEMVVGNMGSAERFDYTVAGDSVNLASRLESLTKRYGVFCLVGDATRRAVGPAFTFREVDLVQVKGRHEPVAIHELLAGPGRTVASYRELPRFDAALAAWRKGCFGEARASFFAFRDQNPDDPVCRMYLERLAGQGEVAPDGFSPVFIHETK